MPKAHGDARTRCEAPATASAPSHAEETPAARRLWQVLVPLLPPIHARSFAEGGSVMQRLFGQVTQTDLAIRAGTWS
jgi:hypothetical protein